MKDWLDVMFVIVMSSIVSAILISYLFGFHICINIEGIIK